eukprot:m.306977 g.306977  ORF g.306977 m.306977 type:complete len:383 (+) comp41795_c0_seq1:77-1225(+)
MVIQCLFVCALLLPCVLSMRVGHLTLLSNAESTGAVCLDGSPPAYYFSNGTGSDANNWIIHLEGGGWCYNEEECYGRSKSHLGSSKKYTETADFQGFLDSDPTLNPKFSNWTVAYVKYCDGASFSGNKDEPITVENTKLFFRGHRILVAVIDDLMERGLKNANATILTGCSAGGLSTYLHLDYFRSRIPASIPVHGLPDAGYFIDAANTKGQMAIRASYQYVYHMQNCSGGVNDKCIMSTKTEDQWQCFMAQYTYPHIETPIFVLNSEYDTWQLGNILQLGCVPPHCDTQQMQYFTAWRGIFLKALAPAIASPTNGLFTDACLVHCQSMSGTSWMKFMVDGQSAHDTFADWYFGSGGKPKVVDGPYPENESCVHHVDLEQLY